jgi:phage/plasmid-like protein (TIGR03299 family)
MSKESSTWLNTQTLIGFVEKRGQAWHYRESSQGVESNHYAQAIPEADVKRRLFSWEPQVGIVSATYSGGSITADDRQAIIRPAGTFGDDDQGEILGLFKSGYKIHDYDTWLVQNVSTLLDSDLSIGSAGLLKGGAVAWVQVEMPDTITTPEGVEHRPFLTAATSCDGSLSSTYKVGTQLVVCDNTLTGALSEKTETVKVKHSVNSLNKINDVRDALGIVYATGDAVNAEIARLTQIDVSDRAWSAFLDAHVELPELPAGKATSRSYGMAERKREALTQLWNNDNRVSPWRGTGFGVVQAVNTHAHHIATVRNAERAERNQANTIDGTWTRLFDTTVSDLNKALVLTS